MEQNGCDIAHAGTHVVVSARAVGRAGRCGALQPDGVENEPFYRLPSLPDHVRADAYGHSSDPSIILFQLLLLRGVFTVLNSLYTNYLLSLGFGSDIVKLEILRDTVAIIALGVTFPFLDLTAPGDPVYGIRILLWGQLVATVLTWVATLVDTVRRTRIPLGRYIADMMPYLAQTLLIVPVMWYVGYFFESAWMKLIAEAITGVVLYVGGNKFFGSRIQKEVLTYFRKGKIM